MARQKMPAVWVLLGPPGSGKGTYAKILAPRLRVDHVSIGDLARQVFRDESFAKYRATMDAGQLLPNQVVLDLLMQRLASVPDDRNAALLDGYPRTLEQAQTLESLCDVVMAVQVLIKDEHIVSKLAGRRVCSCCGRGFNIADVCDDEDGVYMPPILPEGRSLLEFMSHDSDPLCPCGGQLRMRPDDEPAVVQRRLSSHHELSRSVTSFYRDRGVLLEYRVRLGVPDMDELACRMDAMAGTIPPRSLL